MKSFVVTMSLLLLPIFAQAGMSYRQVYKIMMCKGMVRCNGSANYGGPCYRGYGGPLYAGYGGPCYDGYGGPLYSGYGGPLYNGYGGNCYSGYGGNCYSGYGGNCSSAYGNDPQRCPLECTTVCN